MLAVERDGSLEPEAHETLLRDLHTLKGNAGMLGLTPVVDYVHALEDRFRTAPAEWQRAELDPLFAGAAALRHAIEVATTDAEADAFTRLAGLSPAEDGTPAVAEPVVDLEPAPSASPAPDLGGTGEVLRVPWAKLDRLLDGVGELAAVAAALGEIESRNRAALAAIGVRRPLLEEIEGLERTAAELRRSATELRLVPVGRLFARFPALAGELAREAGKRVRVEISGEATELDKSTVDALGEPLLHLLRNAMDHGTETPAERAAAGKPEENLVRLTAEQSGDQVRITLEDDGRGLDRDAILARAGAAGLVVREDTDPTELIFRPGFSTRSEADTLSGRGLGLDIVRHTVRRLRGTLDVEDAQGGGTRFVLHLPLTVAVVPVMLVEAGGQPFAIPAGEVEETVPYERVSRIGPAEVLVRDDETIALAHPARLFGWKGGNGDHRFLVVVRRGRRAAALGVDRLLDQRSALVKALPPWLGQPTGVAGAIVDHRGRVVLLLDVAGILDLNLRDHAEVRRAG